MEGLGGRVGMKCRRWSPTAEQVKVLTALFRSGLRTPSTEQIRRISDHLGAFGKVESKNVFYWFQNHKARERHHHHHRKRGRRGRGACSTVQNSGHEGVRGEARTYSHRLMTCDLRGAVLDQEPDMWERPMRELETLELFPLNSYTVDVEEAPYTTSGSGVQCRDVLLLGAAGRDDPPLALRLSCGGLYSDADSDGS